MLKVDQNYAEIQLSMFKSIFREKNRSKNGVFQ